MTSLRLLGLLTSLALALPVQAQLSGSDTFSDNSKDTTKWGGDVVSGGASLMEVNSRLEYRVTTPDGDFDEALRPWVLNSARNSDAFDVIVDVFNNVSPTGSNNASIGLVVTSLENDEDSIFMELFRGGPNSDGKGFLAALSSAAAGGEVLPYTMPTSHAAVTTASVRLNYNPSTLIFTAYYDATGSADGFQWVAYGTFGVGISGGGTIRNSPWQLTQNLGFKVSVSAFSEGLVVASGTVHADNFSINPPTVASITPASGPTSGGTSVTITGTNFTGATGVTIGGAAATSVTVVNATTITAITPPGSAGPASVVVTTPSGSNSANSLFTYVASPTPSVSVLGLTKTRHHDQTAAGTTLLHDYSMHGFLAGPSHSASVPSSSNRFTRPGGGPYALIFDDGRWGYRVYFPSKTLLDAEFPNTTYDFLIGTSPAVVLSFGAENYPVQPVITASAGTWSGGRLLVSEAEALAGFTLTSNISNGPGLLSLEVYSDLEDILYETRSNPGLNESISGTVPPGSLSLGQVYEVTAEFDHGSPGVSLAGQSWALPGAQGYTLFSSNTRFEMEVVSAPTVTAISPTSGPTGGGTSVTITGTNFTGATGVTIGGAAATSVTVLNATTITCLTPAGTAGAKSVVVTTPGGSNSANSLFTYVAPAPTVTAITPSSGPTTGGTSVTITGTNFTGATGVTIGGAAATSVSVVNATTITCVTPAGTAGAKSVVVTTPGGSNSANSLFTYVAPPTVTSVAPANGPIAGGTSVTITGTNFAGATGVTIGGVTATSVSVVNSTSITCVTPAGTAGSKSVVVTTPGGSNSANSLFTYVAAPTVASIAPASGPTSGGTSVTITGTNFTGATGVTLGGSAATNVSVVNATTITCITPARSAGAASVVVTTPGGSNSVNSLFSYLAAPTVTSISPSKNPLAGGVSVTITGTNFTGATGVTIGGAPATSVNAVNDTTITCVTPAAAAGAKSVVVTTPGGSNGANSLLTYVAAPTVTSIAPTSGPTAGGTSVTITGTDFTWVLGVTIGGVAAMNITEVNPTTITATTPAGTAGTASVVVNTAFGSSSANSLFTYVAPAPTVTAISPASGPTSGGTSVTITGTNFTGATGVTIGGTTATSVSVVNDTKITAITPAGTAGTASVVVTTPSGSNSVNSLFTYVAPPTVTSIAPASGPTSGGTSVTITGTNFTGATGVTIGGAAATSVTVVNATSITCVTPSGTAGARSVVVTTPGGSNSANSLFTYVAAPTVTAIAPNTGTTTGGTSVTISGTGFTGATGVTIGGAAATGITVVNATTITATTPARSVGTASVLVTTAGGTNAANTLYTYVAPPTVTAINPASGSTLGGTSVTITGTNLTGAAAVTIGGTSATSVNVVNATTITCITPAHAAGVASVLVTTVGGTNAANTLYTYVAPPTVTLSTANLPTTATTLTLTGTGFSTTPGNNTVAFTPTGTGTVTASTGTSLTVTSLSGLTLGALSAVVTTNGLSSGAAVQVATVVAPGPGDLDPLNLNIVGSYVGATAVQPDGKTIIAGEFTSVLGVVRNNIARLNADGTLDAGFNPNANGVVYSVAVQADGQILLGGTFTSVGGTTRNHIARVAANGTLDAGFNPGANNDVYSVAVQADGQILLGGAFNIVGGDARNHIARVATNGTLDAGFNPGANSNVYSLAVQADGQILLGGFFTSVGGTTRNRIARVAANGTLDAAFNPNANGLVRSVAVQADGQILLGGTFTSVGGTTRNYIARVAANGTLDASFNPGANNDVLSVAVQADGQILLGGFFSTVGGTTRNRIARVAPNGTLDAGFNPNAINSVNSVAVQADGKVLLGGTFITMGGTARNLFARLLNDPATQSLTIPSASRVQWLRGGASPEVEPVTFELSTDGGTIYSALGAGTRISGGWERTALTLPPSGHIRARGRTTGGNYNGTGGLVETVASFSVAVAPTVTNLTPANGSTAGGTSVTITGTNLTGATAVAFGGTAATSFAVVNATTITATTPAGTAGAKSVVVTTPGGSNSANSLFTYVAAPTVTAIAPNTGTTAGGTSVTITGTNFSGALSVTIGGVAATGVTVVNDTTIHAVTGPHSAGNVDVTVTTSGGQGTGAALYTYITQIAADSLDANAIGYDVEAMVVQPDGKTIIAGEFTSIQGVARNNIARLNADGTLDQGFNPNAGDVVRSVALQTDGKILIGGSFTTVAGTSRNRIARLNADGTLDAAFNPNANSAVRCLALQADGKILLGGLFGSVGGSTRNQIARLNANGTVDTGFNPGATTVVYSLAVQADSKIILGGGFSAVGGTARSFVARVNEDGSLDTSFTPAANDNVWSVALQPDGRILIGGSFTNVNGATRNRIARLNSDGTLDTGFNPNADSTITSMALQTDGKILLAGAFNSLGGSGRFRIGRINANGTLDAGFNPAVNNSVWSVVLHPDGRILLGGTFTMVGTTPRSFLARLSNDPATQMLSVPAPTQISWNRGGSAPEVSQVTFEKSSDSGVTWTPLGNASRVGETSNWQLAGINLVGSGQVRVRARITGGYHGGSSSLIEATSNYDFSISEPAWPGTDDFNDSVSDPAKWAAADSGHGGAQLIEAGGRLEYRVSTPDGDYDEALRHWLATVPTNSEAFEAIVDVHNGVVGNNASIGLTVTSLQDARDSLYLELYRVGPDGSGFLAALRSNVHGGDEVPPNTLPSGHGVTDGAVRLVFDPVTKIFTTYYDTTGSGDGYQWQVYGSFGVGASGGGTTRNSPWLLGNNAGFRISISGLSEGLVIPAGQVYADNFRVQVPSEAFQRLLTWAAAAGLSGNDAEPDAEPFGDGVPNLLKYAFNMNGSRSDVSVLIPGTGESGLPRIDTPTSGTFRFEFLRRVGSGLIYTPEKSGDLHSSSWQPLTDTPAVILINAEWERVIYEEPYTPGVTPQLFGRVQVNLP
ncbi:MAG: IPT/TIG domain-containing protein [Prosthecobacter sp.]|uniref:IPT/TIG domain-containing protein n=1 Tax=Prosthecobacter sp. TaxID=1965333 RepID=UPI001A076844|nr:IPT/TIG domain-containing protein [Prosthecobacter sp.]MBE2285889.1 IPT/TIG domain-containing protein [Prosthecobacter sp.]